MTARDRFAADIEAYKECGWMSGRIWWLLEPSLWAVACYRMGEYLLEMDERPYRGLLIRAHSVLATLSQVITGIEIGAKTEIGPGLRIWHGQNLVINPATVIGARCVMRQGVTLGNLVPGGACPVIGDDVEFGTYAQILGGVTVGDGAKIGSHAVVLRDVPAGATAVGVPARVIVRG
jgi:serine O-acetyltransferase